jgi:hypothetical protein
MNTRWPDVMSDEELSDRTNQKPVETQIKERKWCWIGHILREPNETTEKFVLKWNHHGTRKHGQPEKTWKRTIKDKALKMGKTWREVKRLAKNLARWRHFIDILCSRWNDRK